MGTIFEISLVILSCFSSLSVVFYILLRYSEFGIKFGKGSSVSRFLKFLFLLVFSIQLQSLASFIYEFRNFSNNYRIISYLSISVGFLIMWPVQTLLTFLKTEGLLILYSPKIFQLFVMILITLQIIFSIVSVILLITQTLNVSNNIYLANILNSCYFIVGLVACVSDVSSAIAFWHFSPIESDPTYEMFKSYGALQSFLSISLLILGGVFRLMNLEQSIELYLVLIVVTSLCSTLGAYILIHMSLKLKKLRLQTLQTGK
jgi:hypothetical protein